MSNNLLTNSWIAITKRMIIKQMIIKIFHKETKYHKLNYKETIYHKIILTFHNQVLSNYIKIHSQN